MNLSIVHYPHPTLRFKSKPIQRVDSELREIAARMLELMYQHEGVGLAANQVDLPIRMFVVNESGQQGEGEEMVLINPELQLPKGSEIAQEGCLSLPGVHGQVQRPKSVRLSAYDISGKQIECEVEGFLARILQHENDHLDGVMFFDRLSDYAHREIEDQLEEIESEFRSKQLAGKIPKDAELVKGLDHWIKKYT